MTPRTIDFYRRFPNGDASRLGHASYRPDLGWKFFPANARNKPSRKFWETMDGCLPRWLHYPDGCESRERVTHS